MKIVGNKNRNQRKMVHLVLLGAALGLTGCSSGSSGGGSGNSTDNGDAGSLQIITPKTIYSKPGLAGSGYVVINNPTNAAVKICTMA